MAETTTVAKTTQIEVPVTEERKARTYHVIVNYVGEVQHAGTDRKEAEDKLVELAGGRYGTLYPRLFLIEAKGIPTGDEAEADEKA